MSINRVYPYVYGGQSELKETFNEHANTFITKSNATANFLFSMIKMNNKEYIEKVLDLGGKLNSRSSNNFSPLMYACQVSDLDMVQFLVDKGANIFELDVYGHNMFHYALENNIHCNGIALFLVEKGLNPFNKNFMGWNVFMLHEGKKPNLMKRVEDVTTYTKGDTTVYEALSSGEFDFAYQISNLNLNKIGPINTDYARMPLSLFLRQSYTASLFNQKYEEAFAFSDIMVKLHDEDYEEIYDAYFLEALKQMKLGNYELAATWIDKYISKCRPEADKWAFALFTQYYLFKKIGDNKNASRIKSKIKRKMDYYLLRNQFPTYIAPLMLENLDISKGDEEHAVFERVKELEEKALRSELPHPYDSNERVMTCTMAGLYFDLVGDVVNRDFYLGLGASENKKDYKRLETIANFIIQQVFI